MANYSSLSYGRIDSPLGLARRLLLLLTASLAIFGWIGVSAGIADDPPQGPAESSAEMVRIEHIAPDPRGGRAYQLVYTVPVPIEVHWAFKTDFDNDFLVENRFIEEHRFVSRADNVAITRNKYSNGPNVIFRWKTRVIPEAHRLEFTLTNPEECGQRFHYGHIILESVASGTRITQIAYFDFRGVSIWAAYPWSGGMKAFLSYTARWEQDIIVRLKQRYSGKTK